MDKKKLVFIVILIVSLLCNFIFLGRCLYEAGRNRAQSESYAELEQRFTDTNERLERTIASVEYTVQATSVIIPETIGTVGELRETLKGLEDSYNSMRNQLIAICNDDSIDRSIEIDDTAGNNAE